MMSPAWLLLGTLSSCVGAYIGIWIMGKLQKRWRK